MERRTTTLIATLLLVAAWATAATAEETDLKGSYWYVFDHVIDVAEDAEIVLAVALPPSLGPQKVKIGNIYPAPERVVEEEKYGNRLVVWRIAPEPGVEQIYCRIDFDGSTTAVLNDVDPEAVRPADPASILARTMTGPDRWIEIDAAVAEKARAVAGGEDNPYLQARAIFDWMIESLEFVPGGYGRPGAAATLESGKGDCGQFSRLFAGMCRSLGIPARTVTNQWLAGGLHRYAEFHVEPYGWLPVDVATAQALVPEHSMFDEAEAEEFRDLHGIPSDDPGWLFGNLYPRHLVMVVGNDLALPPEQGQSPVVYAVMEPGGAAAWPDAVVLKGLNDDVVHGGFYVFGEPVGLEEAHQLAHQKLADRFFEAGMYEAVEQGCLSESGRTDDSVAHWINLGRVKLHKGEYDRAEACFRRALLSHQGSHTEVVGARVWAHNYLGNCYDLMKRRAMAEAEYRKVLQLDVDDHDALSYARRYLAEPFDIQDNQRGAGPLR